jgi:hypothetical protein
MKFSFKYSLLSAFAGIVSPSLALACACGCGVFDVQTGSMLPTQQGGTVWAEYDFMDQYKNWSGTSSSPAANNSDKVIRTDFITVGGEYMFNRDWGVIGEVPYWDRYFKTTDDSGNIAGYNHNAFGDVRLKGVYSGFSSDMSTGITFGLKLPTGDYSYANFDRDTEIGTGSTDLLLGAYHFGKLTNDGSWDWFANGELDQPFLITAGYRPGSEVDAVTGVYYDKWSFGGIKVAPIAQVIGSYRLSDRGPAADPQDSGYKRVLLSPGVEISAGSWKLNTDVAFPVYQDMTGNQLTAPVLVTATISHDF